MYPYAREPCSEAVNRALLPYELRIQIMIIPCRAKNYVWPVKITDRDFQWLWNKEPASAIEGEIKRLCCLNNGVAESYDKIEILWPDNFAEEWDVKCVVEALTEGVIDV